jgi:hypothetical protein
VAGDKSDKELWLKYKIQPFDKELTNFISSVQLFAKRHVLLNTKYYYDIIRCLTL